MYKGKEGASAAMGPLKLQLFKYLPSVAEHPDLPEPITGAPSAVFASWKHAIGFWRKRKPYPAALSVLIQSVSRPDQQVWFQILPILWKRPILIETLFIPP